MLPLSENPMLQNQKSVVVWFTGLSGSGKSTLADGLAIALQKKGVFTRRLDGDQMRNGINKNLGYSEQDREENIRRVAEISKLFIESGVVCINSFISPTEKIRTLAKDIIERRNFIEIYLSTPLKICEKRDVKGWYKKARDGKVSGFTGIDAPYEAPHNPDLEINTAFVSIDQSIQLCLDKILNRIISPGPN
jgi:adenylylsulfate kinase